MKNPVEVIVELIRNKVWHLNYIFRNEDYTEVFNRYRNELNGMLVCLKNINEDERFYCINFMDYGVEFGYYDEDGVWNIIEP